ncbi:hypothetical protein [Halomonas sp. NO4]|uniref:hypothetical protein n=1 Tax=Halomonas sp. NO4 TaxID=2484813 RepID=UPI0013D5331C|nr:hypothetical protein [Halomonas sp. NO4]
MSKDSGSEIIKTMFGDYTREEMESGECLIMFDYDRKNENKKTSNLETKIGIFDTIFCAAITPFSALSQWLDEQLDDESNTGLELESEEELAALVALEQEATHSTEDKTSSPKRSLSSIPEINLTSDDRNSDSELSFIIRSSRLAEKILKEDLGATGTGLHELITSISDTLGDPLVKRMRYMAAIRNKAAHEDSFELSEEGFKSYYEATLWIYKNLDEMR